MLSLSLRDQYFFVILFGLVNKTLLYRRPVRFLESVSLFASRASQVLIAFLFCPRRKKLDARNQSAETSDP